MAQAIKESMVWKGRHISSFDELVKFLRWLTECRREYKLMTVQCGWHVEAELAPGEQDFVGFPMETSDERCITE